MHLPHDALPKQHHHDLVVQGVQYVVVLEAKQREALPFG